MNKMSAKFKMRRQESALFIVLPFHISWCILCDEMDQYCGTAAICHLLLINLLAVCTNQGTVCKKRRLNEKIDMSNYSIN